MTKLFAFTVALVTLAGTASAQDCSCNRIGSTSTHGYFYLDGGTATDASSSLRAVKWYTANAHIDVMDGKNLYFNYYAGGHVLFGNANSGAHSVIRKDGTIGIGTASPLHAFHFVKNQDARTRLLVENVNTGANQEASITVQSNGTAMDLITYGPGASGNMGWSPKKNSAFIRTHTGSPAERLVIATGSASPIQFAPNDHVKMTILPTGLVGISTTSPREALEVNGSAIIKGKNLDQKDITYMQNSGSLLIGWNRSRGWGETNFISNRAAGSSGGFDFRNFDNNGTETVLMRIKGDGNVGIGTSTPDSKLTVKGTIHAEEVKVDLNVPGPDYVFDENYPLLPLEETKAYVEQNKHLPGIPSSAEMQQNGVNLLEMNMKLLEKVEELTLYLIEMEQRKNQLTAENKEILRRLEKLEKQ